MPKLVLITKGKARTIEMGQELTIGRGYSNLLRLDGEEISRVHAIIYRRNDDFILRDLDSKNGVYVNGSRTAFAQLDPGDRLQVGKYRMIFDPPSDFDFEGFAESGMSQTASGSGSNGAGGNIFNSDEEFARSQRFSAVPSQPAAAPPPENPEPEICREEVLIYTRPELDQRIIDQANTSLGKAVDYQDDFFTDFLRLMQRDQGRVPFSELVLHALVKALSAHRGVVIKRDPETNGLSPVAVYPANAEVAVNSVVLRSGFSEGKAMLCPSAVDCGLFRDSATVTRDRIGSLISIPLGHPQLNGLLYVDRQGDEDGFNIAHLLAAGRVGRLLEAHFADKATI